MTTLEPTAGEQIAWLCFLIGGATLAYWIVRGVLIALLIAYAIAADIAAEVRGAHRRGIARLRAYEAKLDR